MYDIVWYSITFFINVLLLLLLLYIILYNSNIFQTYFLQGKPNFYFVVKTCHNL